MVKKIKIIPFLLFTGPRLQGDDSSFILAFLKRAYKAPLKIIGMHTLKRSRINKRFIAPEIVAKQCNRLHLFCSHSTDTIVLHPDYKTIKNN